DARVRDSSGNPAGGGNEAQRSGADEELQRIARPRKGARPKALFSLSPLTGGYGCELYFNKGGLWP
ncbi:MAG: hypothetical protein LBI58_04430, partial [Tannerellaceae bacterium]|nr:hypothetical protein [Tannerellaceae bacterium]